jgi:hypothetical protein
MHALDTNKKRGVLLGALIFFAFAPASYAADECTNTNPYMQQTCESLRKSAFEAQKAREEQDQKNMAKQKGNIRKRIEEENKLPESPPPELPSWQKALQEPEITPSKPDTDSIPDTEAPQVKPLPPPEPTEFSSPKAVTLPGGVNIIPKNPDENKSNKVKYY